MKISEILSTLFAIFILVILISLFIFGVIYLIKHTINTKKICNDYYDQGYESYQDIATHKDCKLTNDTNYGLKFIHEVYNNTCRLEKKDLNEYGKRCVWGSSGYLNLVFIVGGLAVLFLLIIMTIRAVYDSGLENKKNK